MNTTNTNTNTELAVQAQTLADTTAMHLLFAALEPRINAIVKDVNVNEQQLATAVRDAVETAMESTEFQKSLTSLVDDLLDESDRIPSERQLERMISDAVKESVGEQGLVTERELERALEDFVDENRVEQLIQSALEDADEAVTEERVERMIIDAVDEVNRDNQREFQSVVESAVEDCALHTDYVAMQHRVEELESFKENAAAVIGSLTAKVAEYDAKIEAMTNVMAALGKLFTTFSKE